MLRYSSSALARAAAGHRVASIARLLNPGFYSFSSTVDGAASDSATDGGDRTASLHERGVLDSNDLLQFTTLYELQKQQRQQLSDMKQLQMQLSTQVSPCVWQ